MSHVAHTMVRQKKKMEKDWKKKNMLPWKPGVVVRCTQGERSRFQTAMPPEHAMMINMFTDGLVGLKNGYNGPIQIYIKIKREEKDAVSS